MYFTKNSEGDQFMSGISQEKILNYLKENGNKTLTEIRNNLDKGLMNKGHYKVLEKVLEYRKRL